MQSFRYSGLLFVLSVVLPATGWADESKLILPNDIEPPEVIHDTASQAVVQNNRLTVTARVRDPSGIKSVTLFYRSSGTENFKRKVMSAKGNEFYQASLNDRTVTGDALEYYLKAEDNEGNSVLKGASFNPMAVRFVRGKDLVEQARESAREPQKTTTSTVTTPAATTGVSGDNNTWMIVGGIAAVVAIAALAGGGGGGGETPAPANNNATITFTGAIP